jgi:4-amino-4-deoxy-L-arabinose transferase-like glycosyltransferase
MKKYSNKIFIITFAVIIVAALFIRTYQLDWEHLGYGEIEILQAAQEYARGNFVKDFYIFSSPPLPKYIAALSFMTIDNLPIALRIVPLIFGILILFGVFKITNLIYDMKTAILATAITAFSIIQIQFSRYGQPETMLTFFYIMTLYFLWKIVHENNRWDYAFLGTSLALGMLAKYDMIFAVITVIIYAIAKKLIWARIKKKFSIEIDTRLIKAFLVAIVVFFLLWPFAFSTLDTNIKIDVEGRGINTSMKLPIFILSIGQRFTDMFVKNPLAETYPNVLPVVGYFQLFLVKESVLFVALFFIGLYLIINKTRNESDKFVLLSIIIFFLLISQPKFNYSYRHIVPVIPLLAIVAARSIQWIKKRRTRDYAAVAIGAILLITAAASSPSYALYYNPLNGMLHVPESEGRFSEGLKELSAIIEENCTTFYGDPFYIFMLQPYNTNIDKNKPNCYIFNDFSTNEIKSYAEKNSCTLLKTITKNSIKLIYIYKC